MKKLFVTHPLSLVLSVLLISVGIWICYDDARSLSAVLFGVCMVLVGVRRLIKSESSNKNNNSTNSTKPKSTSDKYLEWLSALSVGCISLVVLTILVLLISYSVSRTYNQRLVEYALLASFVGFVLFSFLEVMVKLFWRK